MRLPAEAVRQIYALQWRRQWNVYSWICIWRSSAHTCPQNTCTHPGLFKRPVKTRAFLYLQQCPTCLAESRCCLRRWGLRKWDLVPHLCAGGRVCIQSDLPGQCEWNTGSCIPKTVPHTEALLRKGKLLTAIFIIKWHQMISISCSLWLFITRPQDFSVSLNLFFSSLVSGFQSDSVCSTTTWGKWPGKRCLQTGGFYDVQRPHLVP